MPDTQAILEELKPPLSTGDFALPKTGRVMMVIQDADGRPIAYCPENSKAEALVALVQQCAQQQSRR